MTNQINKFLGQLELEDIYIIDNDHQKISLLAVAALDIQVSVSTLTLKGQSDDLSFVWQARKVNKLLYVSLEMESSKGILVSKICAMDFKHKASLEDRFFVNHSSKYYTKIDDLKYLETHKEAEANFVCGLYFKEQDYKGMTLTHHIPMQHQSSFNLTYSGGMFRCQHISALTHHDTPKKQIVSDTLVIAQDSSFVDGLTSIYNSYDKNHLFEKPIGWSSWDYYFTSVTPEVIRENLTVIEQNLDLKKHIQYIVIDDGWQQREGDWYPGGRFKDGLEPVVKLITDKGFRAGIWTAPVRMHYLSATVMRNYDFLLKNEEGQYIMDEDMYIVDPTHPNAKKYLESIFKPLKKAGFTFFKIDFVRILLKQTNFYDKTATPYDALRLLFKYIRSFVGEDSHIMGCSLPNGVGYGYCDSIRTGLDIHNQFGHLETCTMLYTPQFAQHRLLYQNDVDYLVVRGIDTSLEKETNVMNPFVNGHINQTIPIWRQGEVFTYNEARMWCTVVLLSGSSIFLGDRLSKLNEKGMDLLTKTLAFADFKAAQPIDIIQEKKPYIWQHQDQERIYITNWDAQEKTFSIKTTFDYKDIFTSRVYHSIDNELEFSLEGHDGLALIKLR